MREPRHGFSFAKSTPSGGCRQHHLVAFLGECHYTNITSTRSLFLSCFRLSKGSGGYYLFARPGFRVSGAPSSNKGWKGRFFYVCCSEGWSFGLQWATRVIDNTAPTLNDEEHRDLRRLKGILPTSQAIGQMTEGWLVEAGLSSVPRGMPVVGSVRVSSAASPRPLAEPRVGSREAPVELEASRPQKKVKTCIQKKSDAPASQPEGGVSAHVGRDWRRGLGRGEVGPSREVAGKAAWEPSIRDLCRLPTGAPGESYQARAVGELPEGQPSDPLLAQWAGLTHCWPGGPA
ncbi:hypothetical protein C4D60_Mb04t18750 [Musa balbisiana]|uniref:Uncharacterized protein n=1 Tax=Musa balbisiana TaxID=52838 RepID=A0A4S8KD12_MUSBA|nr:hypothetical protein C4D60_Mb04t18750 [Musa balbisiana]